MNQPYRIGENIDAVRLVLLASGACGDTMFVTRDEEVLEGLRRWAYASRISKLFLYIFASNVHLLVANYLERL